jgi:hypothetical protein
MSDAVLLNLGIGSLSFIGGVLMMYFASKEKDKRVLKQLIELREFLEETAAGKNTNEEEA